MSELEPASINPATGERLRSFASFTDAELEGRVARAHAQQRDWAARPLAERADALRALGAHLRTIRGEAAATMTAEMGKPLAQAQGELDKCAWLCEWLAEHGPAMLADEPRSRVAVEGSQRSYVAHRPMGLLLAIMPWNFPWWQALRFAAPALLAGNTALLKHAPNTTGCALAIEAALLAAGFPEGCLETLVASHGQVAGLIADRRVRGVTLTGSTRAGRSVAALAGQHLKKTVLELGGSDPYLILPDADLDHAAAVCAKARLFNSGQTCVAAKRFLVCEPVAEAFTEAFLAQLRAAVVGDPTDPTTTVGPLARADLRAGLEDQVERSVAAGARVLHRSEVPDSPGAYHPVVALGSVDETNPAAREELFGPVAAIMTVRDEAHAVAVANRSDYGLGAAVFSRDVERAEAIARDQLDAGACFVNGMVRSDPRVPFGGVKDSGYGRELGRHGMLEWVNAKTVWVD
ncbi:Aldehyde dehydrogenase [Plesiocystis pacifica SIR-1]|uniref:Aldehyde dehydrogenase n=1 Tax=Plesiocystis pacifica SIR-1 TaxID=391625 RepID=A6G2W7_9BACT|nr:NAD-dependent succinate-semialdehyde dehydrogenase [Plesiocystis pacifica]EDM79817.1 Aldehyde dehydrogenase [Plesiocystis pacifica SIR-1]